MGDHPRIRGEHVRPQVPQAGFEGSSPHTRGAPLAEIDPRQIGRIIPAYAGSTQYARSIPLLFPDHPRIRGEHRRRARRCVVALGSSPHTRGAPAKGDSGGGCRGIIPAYAGSTSSAIMSSRVSEDHPRIRGEHRPAPSPGASPMGSSPHTRGAPGNSPPEGVRRSDHPRIRGEHPVLVPSSTQSVGSSPHTRGAPKAAQPDPIRRRIIPAYAGSTGHRRMGGLAAEDHPRIRGEHQEEALCRQFLTTDHPRIRGEHQYCRTVR